MENIAHYLANGIIGLIIILSVIVLSIIIERLFTFYQFNQLKHIIETLKQNNNLIMKKEMLQIEIILLLQTVLNSFKSNKDVKEKENELDYFLEKIDALLDRRLSILKTVAIISPTLGILGTVLGMIASFYGFMTEDYKQSIFINGILQALYSTAFGLVVSIICIIFFNYFSKKIDNIKLNLYFDLKKIMYKDSHE